MKKRMNNGVTAIITYLVVIFLLIWLSFAYDSCVISSDLPLWAKINLLRR